MSLGHASAITASLGGKEYHGTREKDGARFFTVRQYDDIVKVLTMKEVNGETFNDISSHSLPLNTAKELIRSFISTK